ncbi:MAG TPA: hypothetical protein VMW15_04710 [Terracidiphilus sp.]|nr:hypothetical protein [Terracidiphilus sp.]
MTRPSPTRTRPSHSEQGYILIWVIFLLVVFTIAMSVAAPRVAKEIQLDRERETMERGKQYTRAIQLYYRKFHAYPPNVDALVKTSEIRFLRKKYTDPMTGKDDWKPILFGQNKTPTAMGFFGQPLAGSASTVAGTGPSGGNGLNGASPIGGSSIGGSSSSFGSSSTFSPTSSTSPTSPAAGATPGASSSTGASGSTSDTGSSGQTFGGAGIIGFSPGSTRQSILIYKKKNHYNEWEFVYDPLSDMQTIPGSGNNGLNPTQPAQSSTSPTTQSPTSITPSSTAPTTQQ